MAENAKNTEAQKPNIFNRAWTKTKEAVTVRNAISAVVVGAGVGLGYALGIRTSK